MAKLIIAGLVAVVLMGTSFMFQLMHWPGYLLLRGLSIPVIIFFLFAVYKERNSPVGK